MKELSNIGYAIFMASLSLCAAKQSSSVISLPKYTYMYEKQYCRACIEWDNYYSENYCDILGDLNVTN